MMNQYRTTIAAELRAAAARAQVTNTELSTRTGIKSRTLARTLNGQRGISVEEFATITKALNADPAEILSTALGDDHLARTG